MRLVAIALVCAFTAGCHRDDPSPPPSPTASVPPPSLPPVTLDRVGAIREGSTIALAKLGAAHVALVADEAGSALRIVDLDARVERGALAIAGRPSSLVVTKEGKVLVALAAEPVVAVVEPRADGAFTVASRIPTAGEPTALALSVDERTLFVATAAALTGISLATKEIVVTIGVAPDPRALAVSQDGTTVLVGHGASGVVERIEIGTKRTTAIDLGLPATTILSHPPESKEDRARRELGARLAPNGLYEDCVGCGPPTAVVTPARVARQVLAFARADARDFQGEGLGEHIVFPHVEVKAGAPSDDGALHFTVVDGAGAHRTSAAARMPDACLLPRAFALGAAHALVVCQGSDALQTFALDSTGVGAAGARLSLPAGPSGLALDPETDRVVVFSSVARKVTVVSTHALGAGSPSPIMIALAGTALDRDR